ncbi:hypothetical protein [Devosia sp. A16]|uniref:hypothetical protein n=1 Tax=Devosia sp. A16 TaxID=1736675 RepID=UPI0006D805C4|nr:hypothetical protein [Devosia sp. A16]
MNKHVVHGHVLSESIERRLQRVAERTEKSPARLIEAALGYFLDQIETDAEQQTELEARFQRWKKTGLHVTNDEVKEWLARQAAGEDVPLPNAHT